MYDLWMTTETVLTRARLGRGSVVRGNERLLRKMWSSANKVKANINSPLGRRIAILLEFRRTSPTV